MDNKAKSLTAGSLEARHVPEPDETYDPSAYDDPNHITGFVDVGVEVNGVFVVLERLNASELFDRIERAKVTGPAASQPSE
jgi:hypothetical protein